MGRLHDRMAEDLRLRNFSPATRRNYLLYARKFVAFFMRSPTKNSLAAVPPIAPDLVAAVAVQVRSGRRSERCCPGPTGANYRTIIS